MPPLRNIVAQLTTAARSVDLVFPVHPRTRKQFREFGLHDQLAAAPGVHLLETLGYVQFMGLVIGAAIAIIDSGGLQEETTYLGIPCLTMRSNTERPVTVAEGTNRLVPPAALLDNIKEALAGRWPTDRRPNPKYPLMATIDKTTKAAKKRLAPINREREIWKVRTFPSLPMTMTVRERS